MFDGYATNNPGELFLSQELVDYVQSILRGPESGGWLNSRTAHTSPNQLLALASFSFRYTISYTHRRFF